MPHESACFIVKPCDLIHHSSQIPSALNNLDGVLSAQVDPSHNLVSVEYNSACTSYDRIENHLNKLGFQIAADASRIHTR